MSNDPIYHDGMRQLQDARETRPIADRLRQVTLRTAFTEEDRAFIERCPMFFLATADAQGRPDCSYKGGLPGFVRVVDERTLAFPDYDGNGMYRSLGNVLVNSHVGLLFLDFENPKRIRVNGTAVIREDDPLRDAYPGSVFIVRVNAEQIFPNCPRYIHKMQLVEHSAYAPRADYTPPVPAWKTFETFRDALPARDRPDAPFHAHVYFTAETRDTAAALHARLRRESGLGLRYVGEMRDRGVGPHPIPQFEIHFLERDLPRVVPLLEGSGLTVLVHPLTDDDLADHTTLARWIGTPLQLDVSVLDPPGKNQGVGRFGKTDV